MSAILAHARRTAKPIRPVPASFGAGILPAELPPVDSDRLLSAEQAAQGWGLTQAETWAINAAGHDAQARVARQHAETADDTTFWALVDEAVKAARVEAAATILRESPRSLVSFPRKAAKPAPARPTAEDHAYEAGYSLGESGYEPEQVAAPRHFTASEVEAFAAGVAKGAEARWEEYGRWLEEQADRELTMAEHFGFPLAEVNEAELAEFGSVVGHHA